MIRKADLFVDGTNIMQTWFYSEIKRVLDELVDQVNDLTRRMGSDKI